MSTNPIAALAHHIEMGMNPEKANELKKAQETAAHVSNIAQVALIAGVALSVLGVLTTVSVVTSPIAIIPAALLTLGGLALSYASFNVHHVAKNIKDLLANPRQCTTMMGLGNQLDGTKLRDHVRANTFAFDWVIDAAIRDARKSGFCT